MHNPDRRSSRLLTHASAGIALALALMAAAVQADFYVIPIGRPTIPAGDVVELSLSTATSSSALVPGARRAFRRIAADGTNLGEFVVPPGKVLVVNTAHIFPQTQSGGLMDLILWQRRATPLREIARGRWQVSEFEPTQLEFPPGFTVAENFVLSIGSNALNDVSIRANIFGYLTSAR